MGLKIGGLTIPNPDQNIVDNQKNTVKLQNSESQNAQALRNLSSKIFQAKNTNQNTSLNQTQNVSNEETPNFETIGGAWRKNEKEDIRFYRDGEDISKTTLFDKEYFKTGENEFIRLNKRGALIDYSPNNGKVRPSGISDFEWYGWEKVSADKVPAEYTAEGKTVSFSDPENAKNEMNVFKRYVADNGLLNEGYWDEAKVVEAYNNFKSKGGKIEAEEIGQTTDGKTQYKVKMNNKSLDVFRGEIKALKEQQEKDIIAAEDARNEVNQTAFDHFRILYNSGVNILQGGINEIIEAGNEGGGANPLGYGVKKQVGTLIDWVSNTQDTDTSENRPQIDLSGVKLDYQSKMMRRNLDGIVDGGGIKRGQATEIGVTIGAPIVVGGVGKPTELTELNLTFPLRNGSAAKIGVTNMQTELDPFLARKVGQTISENPVASRAYSQMQKQGTEVKLDFGTPPESGVFGRYKYGNNKVEVFMQNNPTAKEATATMVHESKHVRNRFLGKLNTQYDEYQAFCREFLFTNGRRPNFAERQEIWKIVQKNYSDLPIEKNPFANSVRLKTNE